LSRLTRLNGEQRYPRYFPAAHRWCACSVYLVAVTWLTEFDPPSDDHSFVAVSHHNGARRRILPGIGRTASKVIVGGFPGHITTASGGRWVSCMRTMSQRYVA